ncbi:hypothetical protein ABV409_11155 [Flagellimonas sp. DF-77]
MYIIIINSPLQKEIDEVFPYEDETDQDDQENKKLIQVFAHRE